jgi:hypothetical protein
MGHASEAELRGRIKRFLIKAIEQSSRGGAIKAAVVEAQPDAGHVLEMAPFSFFLPYTAETKPFRLAGHEKEVKRKARMTDIKKRAARQDRTALQMQ